MKYHNIALFTKLVRLTSVKWQQVVEDLRMLKGFSLKIALCVFPGLSSEVGIAVHLFCKRLYQMGKKSGWFYVSLYCKHASACLQQAYGGHPVGPQSVPVSLTRSGYPRIIPSFHRKMIYLKNDRADLLVKFYLSLFSVTKVIPLAPPISCKTFRSITTPMTEEVLSSLEDFCGSYCEALPSLIKRYIPDIATIPLSQGVKWQPSWKSLPNYAINKVFGLSKKSPYLTFPLELKCYGSLLRFIHSRGEKFSSLALWLPYVRYCFDKQNSFFTNTAIDEMERNIGDYPIACEEHLKGLYRLGRLGQSTEGRAKRRIFAIGNYVNQRLLKPVHDWLMKVLKQIPMDGTFNQTLPLKSLVGATYMASVDLSAATDRVPLRLLYYCFRSMFGPSFASSVVNSALATNLFEVPFVRGKPVQKTGDPDVDSLNEAAVQSTVSFVVGQPLGYYSSWPLFALTHHTNVWWAAEQCYPGKLFTSYALLGDDIVIADEAVAEMYKQVMRKCGVEVSDTKSLVSHTGACEFAKRYFVDCLRKDLSPISMKNLWGSHHFYGLLAVARMNPTLSRKTLFRIHGVGYKTLAKICCHNPPRRLKRLLVMLDLYRLPLLLWLGRGGGVSPYALAALVELGFKRLKPKDIQWPPSELIGENPGARYASVLEITLIRSAYEKQLEYLKWYTQLWVRAYIDGEDPISILLEMLDAPIVITDWKVTKSDPEIIRFGMVYQFYDKVGELGLNYTPLCLPCERSHNWVFLADHQGVLHLDSSTDYWGPVPVKSPFVGTRWKDLDYTYFTR